jgi:hypothetical protein
MLNGQKAIALGTGKQSEMFEKSYFTFSSFSSIVLPYAVKVNVGDARQKATELFEHFKQDCADLMNLDTCNK